MKSTTNILFLSSVILFIIALVADNFWAELGLVGSDNIYVTLVGILIFGLSIGGVFIGFKERKEKVKNALIGLVGISILTLIFLIVFFYIALTMKE